MKSSLVAAAFVAWLLLSPPALADDLAAKAPDELCTLYAVTSLTGGSVGGGMFHKGSTQADIAAAIASRAISCEPMDRYFEIAKYRLQRQQEQADRSNAFYNNLQRQNAERFRQQSEDQQRLWQQQRDRNRQTNTTCQTIGQQTYCTTTGG